MERYLKLKVHEMYEKDILTAKKIKSYDSKLETIVE